MSTKISPYDVLTAEKWHSALFTTFSLSLSFFEAVPLHALRAQGARNIAILADVVGYGASLSEAGVADAGRTYDLVPLSLKKRHYFHPKIMLLASDSSLRATVGSGNLTFGGWGLNIEVLDYLVPEQAPVAFGDLADFLGYLEVDLAPDGSILSGGAVALSPMREACERAARRAGDGRTRVLHTYGGTILEQLAAQAEELGGATAATVVSPFFGTAEPIVELARALSCERVSVCVTGRAPEFFDFDGAEAAGLHVAPVRSDLFDPNTLLHAKVIEIVCRRGRLVLSGSVNATRPALTSLGNVEAAVLRLAPDRLAFGWSPADKRPRGDGEAHEGPAAGPCLAARYDGGRISGRIFGVANAGGSWCAHLTSGPTQISTGDADVDPDGSFTLQAPPLSTLVRAAQLVLIRADVAVRGWLGFDQVLAAVRERGPIAEAMLRVIADAGETDDLATILSFFVANPDAFIRDDAASDTARRDGKQAGSPADAPVHLPSLQPTSAASLQGGTGDLSAGATAFERLLASLRRYVREAPQPKLALPDAADGVGSDPSTIEGGALPRWKVEQAINALTGYVRSLFQGDPELRRHLVNLLDFVLFAADRSDDPEAIKATHAREWLRLARQHGSAQADVLDRSFVAVVTSRVMEDAASAARVHAWLQVWCAGEVPQDWIHAARPHAAGLREQRLQEGAREEDWNRALGSILSSRTSWNDVQDVQIALNGGGTLPVLSPVLAAERELLARVVSGKANPDRVMVMPYRTERPGCPRCYMKLPHAAAQKLREHRSTLTPCCDRVLLDPLLD